MRFAKHLLSEAARFRAEYLHSDDVSDKTEVTDDWRDFKVRDYYLLDHIGLIWSQFKLALSNYSPLPLENFPMFIHNRSTYIQAPFAWLLLSSVSRWLGMQKDNKYAVILETKVDK